MQSGILSGKYFLTSQISQQVQVGHMDLPRWATESCIFFFNFYFPKNKKIIECTITDKTIDMSKALLFSKLKTATPVIVGIRYIFCSFRHEMYIVCL